MKEYMNEPVEYGWKNGDIVREYYRSAKDKRAVKRIFCLTAKELNQILKESEAEQV